MWLIGCAAVALCGSLHATTTNLTLAWDEVTGATIYRLYQSVGASSYGIIGTLATTTASVTFDNTNMMRWYVTALNAAGEEGPPSNVLTNPAVVVPPQAPTAPTGLTLQLVTPHRIDVAWSGDKTAATEVWRATGYGNTNDFVKLSTVGTGTLHYSDTSAFKKNYYRYRVRAINGAGISAYSNDAVFLP